MLPLKWAQCIKVKLIQISLVCIYLNQLSLAHNTSWDVSFGDWYPYMAKYHPYMKMNNGQRFEMQFVHLNKTELIESNATIQVVSDSPVLGVWSDISVDGINTNGELNASFVADAIFFGRANIFVEIKRPINDSEIERSSNKMSLTVVRSKNFKSMFEDYYELYETSFYIILRVLCGMAIDWKKVAAILRRPVAPAISVVCNYVLITLSSYIFSLIKFPETPALHFIVFMIGVCMIGGVSDLWTAILGGNLDLSIMMSVINTLLACVMIPFWTLTLGQALSTIQKPLRVDYSYFVGHIIYLVVPLILGSIVAFPIRCCYPRFSRLIVIILRILSPIYIFCVINYAFLSNVDMFIPHKIPLMFSWKYLVAGTLLTIIHYIIGCLAAYKFKQRYKEKLAIAAQTINKNSTIAMSILYPNLFYAEREEAMFLSAVVIMATPLPLISHILLHKFGQIKGTVTITKKSDLS